MSKLVDRFIGIDKKINGGEGLSTKDLKWLQENIQELENDQQLQDSLFLQYFLFWHAIQTGNLQNALSYVAGIKSLGPALLSVLPIEMGAKLEKKLIDNEIKHIRKKDKKATIDREELKAIYSTRLEKVRATFSEKIEQIPWQDFHDQEELYRKVFKAKSGQTKLQGCVNFWLTISEMTTGFRRDLALYNLAVHAVLHKNYDSAIGYFNQLTSIQDVFQQEGAVSLYLIDSVDLGSLNHLLSLEKEKKGSKSKVRRVANLSWVISELARLRKRDSVSVSWEKVEEILVDLKSRSQFASDSDQDFINYTLLVTQMAQAQPNYSEILSVFLAIKNFHALPQWREKFKLPESDLHIILDKFRQNLSGKELISFLVHITEHPSLMEFYRYSSTSGMSEFIAFVLDKMDVQDAEAIFERLIDKLEPEELFEAFKVLRLEDKDEASKYAVRLYLSSSTNRVATSLINLIKIPDKAREILDLKEREKLGLETSDQEILSHQETIEEKQRSTLITTLTEAERDLKSWLDEEKVSPFSLNFDAEVLLTTISLLSLDSAKIEAQTKLVREVAIYKKIRGLGKESLSQEDFLKDRPVCERLSNLFFLNTDMLKLFSWYCAVRQGNLKKSTELLDLFFEGNHEDGLRILKAFLRESEIFPNRALINAAHHFSIHSQQKDFISLLEVTNLFTEVIIDRGSPSGESGDEFVDREKIIQAWQEVYEKLLKQKTESSSTRKSTVLPSLMKMGFLRPEDLLDLESKEVKELALSENKLLEVFALNLFIYHFPDDLKEADEETLKMLRSYLEVIHQASVINPRFSISKYLNLEQLKQAMDLGLAKRSFIAWQSALIYVNEVEERNKIIGLISEQDNPDDLKETFIHYLTWTTQFMGVDKVIEILDDKRMPENYRQAVLEGFFLQNPSSLMIEALKKYRQESWFIDFFKEADIRRVKSISAPILNQILDWEEDSILEDKSESILKAMRSNVVLFDVYISRKIFDQYQDDPEALFKALSLEMGKIENEEVKKYLLAIIFTEVAGLDKSFDIDYILAFSGDSVSTFVATHDFATVGSFLNLLRQNHSELYSEWAPIFLEYMQLKITKEGDDSTDKFKESGILQSLTSEDFSLIVQYIQSVKKKQKRDAYNSDFIEMIKDEFLDRFRGIRQGGIPLTMSVEDMIFLFESVDTNELIEDILALGSVKKGLKDDSLEKKRLSLVSQLLAQFMGHQDRITGFSQHKKLNQLIDFLDDQAMNRLAELFVGFSSLFIEGSFELIDRIVSVKKERATVKLVQSWTYEFLSENEPFTKDHLIKITDQLIQAYKNEKTGRDQKEAERLTVIFLADLYRKMELKSELEDSEKTAFANYFLTTPKLLVPYCGRVSAGYSSDIKTLFDFLSERSIEQWYEVVTGLEAEEQTSFYQAIRKMISSSVALGLAETHDQQEKIKNLYQFLFERDPEDTIDAIVSGELTEIFNQQSEEIWNLCAEKLNADQMASLILSSGVDEKFRDLLVERYAQKNEHVEVGKKIAQYIIKELNKPAGKRDLKSIDSLTPWLLKHSEMFHGLSRDEKSKVFSYCVRSVGFGSSLGGYEALFELFVHIQDDVAKEMTASFLIKYVLNMGLDLLETEKAKDFLSYIVLDNPKLIGGGAQKGAFGLPLLPLLFMEKARQQGIEPDLRKITDEMTDPQEKMLMRLIAIVRPESLSFALPNLLDSEHDHEMKPYYIKALLRDHSQQIHELFDSGSQEKYAMINLLSDIWAITGVATLSRNITDQGVKSTDNIMLIVKDWIRKDKSRDYEEKLRFFVDAVERDFTVLEDWLEGSTKKDSFGKWESKNKKEDFLRLYLIDKLFPNLSEGHQARLKELDQKICRKYRADPRFSKAARKLQRYTRKKVLEPRDRSSVAVRGLDEYFKNFIGEVRAILEVAQGRNKEIKRSVMEKFEGLDDHVRKVKDISDRRKRSVDLMETTSGDHLKSEDSKSFVAFKGGEIGGLISNVVRAMVARDDDAVEEPMDDPLADFKERCQELIHQDFSGREDQDVVIVTNELQSKIIGCCENAQEKFEMIKFIVNQLREVDSQENANYVLVNLMNIVEENSEIFQMENYYKFYQHIEGVVENTSFINKDSEALVELKEKIIEKVFAEDFILEMMNEVKEYLETSKTLQEVSPPEKVIIFNALGGRDKQLKTRWKKLKKQLQEGGIEPLNIQKLFPGEMRTGREISRTEELREGEGLLVKAD